VALREADPRNVIALLDAVKCGPAEALFWVEPPGLGVCLARQRGELYDVAYWDEYRRLDQTDMGAMLTQARFAFVRQFYKGPNIVDIGVGGGRFCLDTYARGYDVNPFAVWWLKENNLWHDVSMARVQAMTFWDSLEHALDWAPILCNCTHWVFVSTPIYASQAHCLCSKHYKPGEHIWYFTHNGLEWFMAQHGFKLVSFDNFETELGRDSIGTFAFRRN
jgi:hypothetical protein